MSLLQVRYKSLRLAAFKAAGVIAILLWLPLLGFAARDAAWCLRLARRVGATPVLGPLARRHSQQFQLTDDESLMFFTSRVLNKLFGWHIAMPLSVQDCGAIETMRADLRSVIIASVHFPYFPGIQMCLENLPNRKIAIVAMHPHLVRRKLKQFFPNVTPAALEEPNLRIIPSDKNCLVQIRKILGEGWIIIANVDFPQEGGTTYDMVRRGMFQLGERTLTQIYSSQYTLTDGGVMEIGLLALPHDARGAAEAFAMHQLPRRTYVLDPLLTSD